MSPARQRPFLAFASALALDPRRLVRATALLILVLVLVSHLPLRHSGYVQDDHVAVETNPIVERGELGEIFSTSYWAGARGEDRSLYRPIPVLSYALERKATGEADPLVSHAVNVALHLLCTWTLLLLARRLGADLFAAAAAALIFAVHPIHLEAVAGIVGRAEILAALFSFAGLLALSHAGAWNGEGAGDSAARHRLAAWLAALLLFLALGAKEVALVTPLLYVGLELLFRPRGAAGGGKSWISRAAALAPSGLAILLYVILRTRALEALLALQKGHPADNPLLLLEGAARLGTALGLVARYVRLLLYPLGLSADYSGPVIEPATGLATAGAVVGTLILLGCIALALRPAVMRGAGGGARRWSFAALLFLLPYLIVGNLLFNVGTIFAERLLYFPSAGFCLMAGLLLGAIASSPAFTPARGVEPSVLRFASSRAAILALSALLAGFMVLTWARARDWRDDETLFRASARAQPRSPRAHHIVGKMLADRGEPEEALPWFDRALELYPAYVQVWNERGAVHGRLGRRLRAERDFREAVRLRPEYADAHLNLAITLRMWGDLDGAERSLRRALLWDPVLRNAWAELGNLYLQMGRHDEAIQAYAKGIALGRRDLVERLREAERRAAAAEREPAAEP